MEKQILEYKELIEILSSHSRYWTPCMNLLEELMRASKAEEMLLSAYKLEVRCDEFYGINIFFVHRHIGGSPYYQIGLAPAGQESLKYIKFLPDEVAKEIDLKSLCEAIYENAERDFETLSDEILVMMRIRE